VVEVRAGGAIAQIAHLLVAVAGGDRQAVVEEVERDLDLAVAGGHGPGGQAARGG
jgi:hypothetical protein